MSFIVLKHDSRLSVQKGILIISQRINRAKLRDIYGIVNTPTQKVKQKSPPTDAREGPTGNTPQIPTEIPATTEERGSQKERRTERTKQWKKKKQNELRTKKATKQNKQVTKTQEQKAQEQNERSENHTTDTDKPRRKPITEETYMVSVKYLEHLFSVNSRLDLTGAALQLLCENGIPITAIRDNRIHYHIMPIAKHGSPIARIEQLLTPPQPAPNKYPAMIKGRWKEVKYLLGVDTKPVEKKMLTALHEDDAHHHPVPSLSPPSKNQKIVNYLALIDLFWSAVQGGASPYHISRWYRNNMDYLVLLCQGQKLKKQKMKTLSRYIEHSNSYLNDPVRSLGRAMLQSILEYRISLNGLVPNAGGYITDLLHDITRELEIAVIDIPLQKSSEPEGFISSMLSKMNDPKIRLTTRIMKGCQQFSSICRGDKTVTKRLINLPPSAYGVKT